MLIPSLFYLQVEPKEISKYRATCSKEIFYGSFQSFKKKLDILLDYGVQPVDILNNLCGLRRSESVFIQHAERILSVGLPIKMRHFKLTEKDLDMYVSVFYIFYFF